LTEAEWAIIKAVWKREPCAAPDIQEELAGQKGWAYSTVRTLMDRMVRKGYLVSEKIRHMDLYRSAVTPKQAQKAELLYALKHAFDNALTPMVQRLLETRELSPTELEELETLIRERRKQAAAKKPERRQDHEHLD